MEIPFLDLSRHHAPVREEVLAAWADIYDSSGFVSGRHVASFESAFAVRQIEVGMASLFSLVFGLTAAVFAVILVLDGHRWLGWWAILGAVGVIVDQNHQIAAAAEQQTAVAHDIDRNIVAINEAGQRTAEGAGHTEQASRELTELVGRLQQLIGSFRV